MLARCVGCVVALFFLFTSFPEVGVPLGHQIGGSNDERLTSRYVGLLIALLAKSCDACDACAACFLYLRCLVFSLCWGPSKVELTTRFDLSVGAVGADICRTALLVYFLLVNSLSTGLYCCCTAP